MIFHDPRALQEHIIAIGGAAESRADIFTDGGCEPNPGAGGFSVIIRFAGCDNLELIGGAPNTTNNRMEMLAVLMAIRALPQGITGVIHSDSQYVIKGITSWMHGWAKAGWIRKATKFGAGGEIQNLDLWQALWRESKNRSLRYEWVKGHDGHEHNERADELAALGRQGVMEGTIAPAPAIEVFVQPPALRKPARLSL